jgi:hypothetical protein
MTGLADRGGRGDRPRGPAFWNTVVMGLVLAVIASLALTARQPAPPALAEFAPQAQHQIKQATPQLSSSQGTGPGGTNGPGGSGPHHVVGKRPATTAPPPPPIVQTAIKHCTSTPRGPIQIPTDTQAPPCIAYWNPTQSNGGATSRGVTATTVRLALPSNDFGIARALTDLETFFNEYFEFYGRKVVFESNGGGPGNCSGQVKQADQQKDFFAAGDPQSGAADCFFQEAAHNHLVTSMFAGDLGMSKQVLRSLQPYVYAYQMPYDEQLANVGAFACTQLANRKAVYSTDPTLNGSTRKFGIILLHDDAPWPVTAKPMENQLRNCRSRNAAPASQDVFICAFTQQSNSATTDVPQCAQNASLQFKKDNVTTVLCACGNLGTAQDFPAAASSAQYYPEWITGQDLDKNAYVDEFWPNANQRTALFNVAFEPPQAPAAAWPLNRALAAVDPGYQLAGGDVDNFNRGYEQLLLLCSGIQMAGPKLTPATFAAGLHRAEFPNPYSPNMEGIASFAGGSQSMTTDAVVAWWSDTGISPNPEDPPNGAWCYADGGRRFNVADWPTTSILPPSLTNARCDSSPPGSG